MRTYNEIGNIRKSCHIALSFIVYFHFQSCKHTHARTCARHPTNAFNKLFTDVAFITAQLTAHNVSDWKE